MMICMKTATVLEMPVESMESTAQTVPMSASAPVWLIGAAATPSVLSIALCHQDVRDWYSRDRETQEYLQDAARCLAGSEGGEVWLVAPSGGVVGVIHAPARLPNNGWDDGGPWL